MRKKLGNKKRIVTYFIFGEGETELCYFEAFKEVKRSIINIKIESLQFKQLPTKTKKIESKIISLINRIESEFSLNTKDLEETKSLVFILLDADVYSKDDITKIIDVSSKYPFLKVLFSNSNFDLFILLHLEYFSGTTNDYMKRIQKYHKDYEKGYCLKKKKIHLDIIRNGEIRMLENIKKLLKYHGGGKHIKELLPFSEVYKIIEAINI